VDYIVSDSSSTFMECSSICSTDFPSLSWKCIHLFELCYVHVIFFFRSSPRRNFIKCQKLDFTTINHGILRLLRHHMGTEKLLSFVMYSLLGYLCLLHCAIVLRCTPYLDCLVPFVWWQVHADETKSSLQFASRALRVTNCARVNEVLR